MTIENFFIEESFVIDYDVAPERVRKKVDWLVDHICDEGTFPNSLNKHKSKTSHIWIGHITRSNQHWRVLFEIDSYTNDLYFLRLVTHKEMDKILRELAKV